MTTKLRSWVRPLLVAFVVASSIGPGSTATAAGKSSIAGVVTGGGAKLAGVEATAYAWEEETKAWAYAAFGLTDAAGRYVIDDLTPGTYKVGFASFTSDDFAAEFHDDVTTLTAAAKVSVGAARLSGIDADLSRAGKISGTVAGAPQPAKVWVSAHVHDGQTWVAVGGRYVAADGSFEIAGLRPGTYRLRFEDETGAVAVEFWPDAATVGQADDIVVEPGRTAGGHAVGLGIDPQAPPTTPPTTPPGPGGPETGGPQNGNPAGPSTPGSAVLRNTARPHLKGKPRVGKVLRARRGAWTITAGVTFRYQWFAGKRKIKKATKAKLKLTRKLKGKKVWVRVTASYDGSKVVVKSKATKKIT